MTADQGRSGVVRDAVGQAAAELEADPGADQLALFEAPTAMDGEAAEAVRKTIENHHRARGAGRPAGAENLATKQLREWLLRRGVSPLENIMRWSLHTPATLAVELRCTKLEAFDRLRLLWSDLAPYLHGRMAPVDASGAAVVPWLNLVFGGQGGQGGSGPPWLLDPEVAANTIDGEKAEQNQADSEAAPGVSHDEKSHDGTTS